MVVTVYGLVVQSYWLVLVMAVLLLNTVQNVQYDQLFIWQVNLNGAVGLTGLDGLVIPRLFGWALVIHFWELVSEQVN